MPDLIEFPESWRRCDQCAGTGTVRAAIWPKIDLAFLKGPAGMPINPIKTEDRKCPTCGGRGYRA